MENENIRIVEELSQFHKYQPAFPPAKLFDFLQKTPKSSQHAEVEKEAASCWKIVGIDNKGIIEKQMLPPRNMDLYHCIQSLDSPEPRSVILNVQTRVSAMQQHGIFQLPEGHKIAPAAADLGSVIGCWEANLLLMGDGPGHFRNMPLVWQRFGLFLHPII